MKIQYISYGVTVWADRGQRQGMKQNTSGAGFTACAVFVILYNSKLHNGGAFRGVLHCVD